MLLKPTALLSSVCLRFISIRKVFLSQVPLVAERRRGRSMAFIHAFILAWPPSSLPQINTLAAAVSHVALNWHWQQ